MAKKSAVERNKNRRLLHEKCQPKREKIKATLKDPAVSLEEKFAARLKLAEMPRNSSRVRLRNRCEISGRPRGFYRKFKMSRIAFRELASNGRIPGVIKSSW